MAYIHRNGVQVIAAQIVRDNPPGRLAGRDPLPGIAFGKDPEGGDEELPGTAGGIQYFHGSKVPIGLEGLLTDVIDNIRRSEVLPQYFLRSGGFQALVYIPEKVSIGSDVPAVYQPFEVVQRVPYVRFTVRGQRISAAEVSNGGEEGR